MSVVRTHDAFSLDTARRRFFFKDDFLGDQLQDLWDTTFVGAGTIVVVDAQTGGEIRFTTGATANNRSELDWNDIRSLHVDQKICMEVRLALTQITNMIVNIELEFDGSNRIRFVFETGIDANWHVSCINGGANTDNDTGIAADTNYHIFRIESSSTSVSFFIDDVEVTGSPITTNIPNGAGDFLQPFLLLRTTENSAKIMDVDYVVVSQERV